jgi:hypothetical protein
MINSASILAAVRAGLGIRPAEGVGAGDLGGPPEARAAAEADSGAEEAAAGQVPSNKWRKELAALRAGRLLLFHNCRAIGGRDFYLALDQRAAAKAPRGPGHPPVLTLAGALALVRRNQPVNGEELYEVMSCIEDVSD